MRFIFIFVSVLLLGPLTGCQTEGDRSDQDAVFPIAGEWQSENVQMIRPGLNETFIFHLFIGDTAVNSGNAHMDITYFSTNNPSNKRVIRQDLAISSEPNLTHIVLSGSHPKLVSGPEIIGVYESDSLTCETDGRAQVDTLRCEWGSDGHGNPMIVTLVKD